jgi:pilus assembly protein Flp/PilA
MNLKRSENGNKAVTWLRRVWNGVAVRLGSMVREDAAVTSIEYALLGALIAVVIAGSVGALGVQLNVLWTAVSDAVTAAVQ